jgi:hypothetical protein
VGINCHKGDKVYYRRQCDPCLRKGKRLRPQPPQWYRSGYRKKDRCEKCEFKAELVDDQLVVFHVDGDLRNTDRANLKTVCLNCRPLIYRSRMPWKESEVIADF